VGQSDAATANDSFENTLNDLDNPVDDDAFDTSEDEAFDSLKGMNLFDNKISRRDHGGALEAWRKGIIDGDKRYKKALEPKCEPDLNFVAMMEEKHRRNMANTKKYFEKNQHSYQ